MQRFVQHEMLAQQGDLGALVANVLAVLGAFGICVAFLLIRKYAFGVSGLPAHVRAALSWSDQEFLISMTITIAGVFVIVSWDALFPDRSDCMVLSGLPVRPRTVLAAKLAAIMAVFWFLVGAANAIPALLFPALMIGNGMGGHPALWFAAHFATMAGAALFVFAAAVAVQGVLINLLPYRLFQKASAACQLCAIVLLLLMFLATPNIAAPDRLAAPENRLAITLVPSFWFLGLYQAMLGSTLPVAGHLASVALAALGIAVGVAALSYWAGYARYVRKTVEYAGAPARHRRGGGPGVVSWLADTLLVRTPAERAIFHFAWRTMVRSRTHRLILAAYMSLGFTYLAMGSIGIMDAGRSAQHLRPQAAIGGIPIVLCFFALAGLRAVFSMPVDLRANWLFRLTEKANPREILAAVKKLMFVLAIAPAVAFCLAVFPVLWGWATALRFTTLMLFLQLIVFEKLMRGYRKIPFGCSYLPGKTNLKLVFAAYFVFFQMAAWTATTLSVAMAGSTRGFAWGAGLSLAWLGWRAWRNSAELGWPGFQYEEKPDWQPVTLELT